MGRLRTLATVTAAAAAVPAAAAVWGIGIERYLFTVREHVVLVLAPGSASLRVLHLSDLHMAPWQRRKQAFVAALAGLNPDLVVNTGDNLGHRDGLAGVRRALDGFAGVPGVFVHGSNDVIGPAPRNPFKYFRGPSKTLRTGEPLDTAGLNAYLEDELGWANLNNAAARVDVGAERVDAFGVSDAHRFWDDLAVLPAALEALPADATLRLGVTHAPYRRVLDRFVDLGADMIFAGHTHGGQVRIPFVGPLVANCDIPLDQARGLSGWQRVPLNVSAGLGHSIYAPVRFACRPEASLLTLVAR